MSKKKQKLPTLVPHSPLEELFAFLWRDAGGEPFETEYRFAPPRRWPFDFAWPELKVAVEIEGGKWSRGRHVRPDGFQKDCEKYNAAAALGWHVLRYTGDDLKYNTNAMIEQIKAVLSGRRDRL